MKLVIFVIFSLLASAFAVPVGTGNKLAGTATSIFAGAGGAILGTAGGLLSGGIDGAGQGAVDGKYRGDQLGLDVATRA